MYEYLVPCNPNGHAYAGYDPPTRPNPSGVRILKNVRNIGRSLNGSTSPNWMVICHDKSWLIMINLQILSWKITKNHQWSQKNHQMSWKIIMLNEHQKSWSGFFKWAKNLESVRDHENHPVSLSHWSLLFKMAILVINHDQSWFPNFSWERWGSVVYFVASAEIYDSATKTT